MDQLKLHKLCKIKLIVNFIYNLKINIQIKNLKHSQKVYKNQD